MEPLIQAFCHAPWHRPPWPSSSRICTRATRTRRSRSPAARADLLEQLRHRSAGAPDNPRPRTCALKAPRRRSRALVQVYA